jgi:dipeptidase D
MCADIPSLVETSNNLSVAKTEDGELKILCLMRSSSQTQCDYLKDVMKFQAEFLGAEILFTDEYPGWQPDTDSILLKEAAEIYEKLFGSKPEITAIHAGLECGIITAKHAGMQALSLGPTMYGVHTPNERLEIKSVGKFYKLICEILKNSPKKK